MAWSREDAAHLLRRAGFGGSLDDVERVYALGQNGAIEFFVDYQATADPVWDNDNPFGLPDLTGQWDGVTISLLYQMLTTRRPLEAKLLWFWHGHFTTPLTGVGNLLFHRQMKTWRQHASGSFPQFLSAMFKDGGMLTYLNGSFSSKRQPNENFAREVQELYTTGPGPYTEDDIKEAARALTGWEVKTANLTVNFNAANFDSGSKTFLGQTGNLDGEDIMRILAQRPETARRLSTKLYRAFVSERINLVDVSMLAASWTRSGGDIKTVMRTLFKLPSFWNPVNRGFIFKTPLEFAFGLVQRLRVPVDTTRMRNIVSSCTLMGQDPFDPPNPAGYATGLRLTGASMLIARTQLASTILNNWATEDSISLLLTGITAPVSADTLITTVANRLGVPRLTADTRSNIANYLGAAPIAASALANKARAVAFLLAVSPEYQVS